MKGSQIPFKKNYILGVSIVLAALVLGLMLVFTVKTLKSYDDTVKVRGLCEKEVPADRVVLRINFSEQDNELADLRATIDRDEQAVIALLKKLEQSLTSEQIDQVRELLAEISVLVAVRNIYDKD